MLRSKASGEGRELARRSHAPRQYQELWFRLDRRAWRSVVLVPAGCGESATDAARSLAEVGKQLHDRRVTHFIMADPPGHRFAVHLITSAKQDATPSFPPSAEDLDYASVLRATTTALAGPDEERASGKVIVAVQPVVDDPLGLAVTQVADAVVLCVRLRETSLADARRTIELIGRERIVGALLLQG